MLDAAKIRVCPLVYSNVADCLLVAILPCRPGWRSRFGLASREETRLNRRAKVEPLLPDRRKLLTVANLRVFGHQRDSLGQRRGTNQAVARVARVVCRKLVGEYSNLCCERTNRHS